MGRSREKDEIKKMTYTEQCSLDRKTIWLYGDNRVSRNSYRKLISDGYEVRGIIDRKFVGQTELDGVICSSLHNVMQEGVEESVCVICLNNGLEHDKTAESLSEAGFHYILYLPMRMNNGTIEDQRLLRKAYAFFSNGCYEKVFVPAYNGTRNLFVIINRSDDAVSFWCPKKILRTGTNEQYRRAAEARKLRYLNDLLQYTDVEIDAFRPYISLFQTLAENKERSGAEEYLRLQRNSEEERNRLFQDRRVLFEVFEERFRYDMTFFLDSPAKTVWNNKGWLTITDGLHRVFYLNYKGYDFYPVSTKKKDFDFCNTYYRSYRNGDNKMKNIQNTDFSRGGQTSDTITAEIQTE